MWWGIDGAVGVMNGGVVGVEERAGSGSTCCHDTIQCRDCGESGEHACTKLHPQSCP